MKQNNAISIWESQILNMPITITQNKINVFRHRSRRDPIIETLGGHPDSFENTKLPNEVATTRVANRPNVQTLFKRYTFFEAVPTQMSFYRSLGLDKKIIDILLDPPIIIGKSSKHQDLKIFRFCWKVTIKIY